MKNFLLILIFLSQFCFGQKKDNIQKIGDISQLLLPITAGVSTLVLKDKNGFIQFIESYGTTFAVTHILKNSISRHRPDKNGYQSFPSGHTSSAFSGASFIQRRYGWKYGIPAYALATFTGYSRIHSNRHYFTDVLAGAIIGIGSTYIFTKPYQQENIKMYFLTNSDRAYLIGLTYKF